MTRRSRHRSTTVRVRRASAALGVAASVAVAGLGAALGWRATHGAIDPVDAAVSAAQQQPVLRSSDPAAIGTWCARTSARSGPPVTLQALTPLGARMDTTGGSNIVTIFYTTSANQRIAVSWLDDAVSAPNRSHVDARTVAGRTVLVTETPQGTAVLSSDGPAGALWSSAGSLEALSG